MTWFLVVAYAAMIPLANWLIGHVSVLRDLVQRRAGIPISLGCIAIGVVLSAWFTPPALVVASASAFLFSELADFAIYTPLARRSLSGAVFASVADITPKPHLTPPAAIAASFNPPPIQSAGKML